MRRAWVATLALGLGWVVAGCTDSDAAARPPRLSSAQRNGSFVDVSFADTRGAYLSTCDLGPELVKASGEPWLDEAPACGAGSYFLDGLLQSNEPGVPCAGCDTGFCTPFSAQTTFSIGERFRTGVMLLTDAGAADAGFAVTSDAASAANAATDAGAAQALPAFESRPYEGELQLIIRYRSDASCGGEVIELPPVPVTVSSPAP